MEDRIFFVKTAYKKAYGLGLVRNKADFAVKVGVNTNSMSKALNGDGSYATENLCKKIRDATKRILAKYSDTKGRYVFPRISNQKANAYIRKACKTAGIDAPLRLVSFRGSVRAEVVKPKWECMTFHAARRTFITMALLLEIPIPVIMSWSGHKDIKMLKPYMAVVDEMRRREMSKFDAL